MRRLKDFVNSTIFPPESLWSWRTKCSNRYSKLNSKWLPSESFSSLWARFSRIPTTKISKISKNLWRTLNPELETLVPYSTSMKAFRKAERVFPEKIAAQDILRKCSGGTSK